MLLSLQRVAAALAVLAACSLLAAQAAPGQVVGHPRPGQRELRGLDFRPDGAWRKRTRLVREVRAQFLRSGQFSALNAPAPASYSGAKVAGNFYVPVILVRPSNVSFPYPASQYDQALFANGTTEPLLGGRPYSLKTFYEELANGNITMDGTVFGPVTLSNTDTYYENGCNGVINCDPSRFGELLTEALDAISNGANGSTVWGQFDNDGPDGVPNSGDDDGYVDFVTFVHPELDGACGTSNIWAHRWVYAGPTGATNGYVTKTPWAGHSGQFLKVQDYTIQSGIGGGNSGCGGGSIMSIGTVAHETGHAFGLPDLYDTGTTGTTEGAGEWSLMGSGNYTTADSPARYDAWSLAEVGWVTVAPLTASATVGLGPVTSSDSVLYVDVPGTDEHFLIENRQALESDAAQMSPLMGSKQKSPGLLVWHVDRGRISQGLPSNSVNTGAVHGVALLQADGLNHLRTSGGGNRGDTGDPYPGSTDNRRLTFLTNPASADNQGAYAGFGIDSINQLVPNGAMTFRFTLRPRSLFTSDRTGALISVNGQSTQRYEDVVPAGDQVVLDVPSPQTVNSGRSRLTFSAWSDGGLKSHVVTSSAARPDTVVASFTAEHRIRVALNGSGSVAASVPGDFTGAGGDYVAENTPVTLTATPAQGQVFAGWSGDTVSAEPTLDLPMARGYNLTANFAGSVAVAVNDAAEQLLRGPTATVLSSSQKSYLDAIGNQNGVYDVGDFLAYLEDSGSSASPELMRKLLARPVPAAAPGRK